MQMALLPCDQKKYFFSNNAESNFMRFQNNFKAQSVSLQYIILQILSPMNKVFYIFSFLILAHFNSFSQESLNAYKYIIVPVQYDFMKEKDQYQINSLTKFLFNKYGYLAFMQDEEMPEDLRNNRCLGLTSEVVKDNSLFKTKMRIDLKDCNGNLIISSQEGETREKDFAKAYGLALRDAFSTFQNMPYEYQPNETILSKGTPTIAKTIEKEQTEISRLKEEIESLKKEQEIVEVEKKMTLPEMEVIKKTEEKPKQKVETMVETVEIASDVLYAQPIDNGFQIVDTTPKKVMILLNSGIKDVFTVEGKNALVYKKGDVWMYSESGDILKGEVINIKF